jgi:hypothetical protein
MAGILKNGKMMEMAKFRLHSWQCELNMAIRKCYMMMWPIQF